MAPAEEKGSAAEAPEDPPAIKELKEVDDKYVALEREFEQEAEKLRKEFEGKRKPLLEERREILAKSEVPVFGGPETGTPALPSFWLKAMENHPEIAAMIEDHDKPVLEHLTDVEACQSDDKSFKIILRFRENPYFTNAEIVKEYTAERTNAWIDEPAVKKITCTEIEWKAGKNVTVEMVAKKVKGGGAKKAKQKKEKEEARASFFRDFARSLDVDMKPTDDMREMAMMYGADPDDEDEEQDKQIVSMHMDQAYEVGRALCDYVVPFAVRWYTGEAAPDEDDDDDDDDDESDEDEDDDSEDDEESEDEKPKPKAKGKASAKKKSSPKTSPELKPSKKPKEEECKQQ